MNDDERHPIESVIDEVQFILSQPLDLARNDAAAYAEIVHLLTAAAMYFNSRLIAEFGGKLGKERAPGLTEQVVAAAFQSFEGEELHPDPFEKAAMLLRGITAGHPFSDANKRTGFLIARFYLENLGYMMSSDYEVNVVVALCQDVSRGDTREISAITSRLRQLWHAE